MKKSILLFLLFFNIYIYAQVDCTKDSIGPNTAFVGLASALVDSGHVEMFALDFAKTYNDNCTPKDKIYFTFMGAYPRLSLIEKEHYFKGNGLSASIDEYYVGKAQKWLPKYKSSEINFLFCNFDNNTPITITAWDEKKNKTNGISHLTLISFEPKKDCFFTNITATKQNGIGLKNLFFRFNANEPEYPIFYPNIDSSLTIADKLIPLEICIEIFKTDELRNGVTSLDLIAIRNHILGIKLLDTPYKLIAADVNGDNKISSADLTLARKISQGLVDKIQGESWIFINTNHVFQNPKNPWFDKDNWTKPSCFLSVNNLNININFIGIKLGDIDDSAKP